MGKKPDLLQFILLVMSLIDLVAAVVFAINNKYQEAAYFMAFGVMLYLEFSHYDIVSKIKDIEDKLNKE